MTQKDRETLRTTLYLIAIGAVVVGSVVLPGLPMILKPFISKEEFTKKQPKNVLKRLEKEKLISVKEENGQVLIEFTKKGQRQILKFQFDKMEIPKPKEWDGFWRVVIFDIPEKKRLARDTLRNKLKQLNFVQIQKSAFAHPYPCYKEIEFIKQAYEINPFVTLITAREIDNDLKLRSHFDL